MFQKCKQKLNVGNEVSDTSCESDMNGIDTYSESEDMIMTILSKIEPYLFEPVYDNDDVMQIS